MFLAIKAVCLIVRGKIFAITLSERLFAGFRVHQVLDTRAAGSSSLLHERADNRDARRHTIGEATQAKRIWSALGRNIKPLLPVSGNRLRIFTLIAAEYVIVGSRSGR